MIIKHQQYDLLQKPVLERVVLTPPFRADNSMHNEACFLYAVNGNGKVYGATQSEKLNSHEGVVMKCGNYLGTWLQNADDKPSEAVAVHFHPDVLKMVYEDKLPEFLRDDGQQTRNTIQKVQVDDMITKYVESLVFYFENPSLINEELIILKIKELILLLVNTDESNQVKDILKDLFNPVNHSFKEIIHSHLFDDLALEDLALITNLSLSSFKRKFKEVFDDSPAHYIKVKRLEKAADMLTIPSNRISDICYECGFSDLGHFSKSFSAHYEMSPTAYRESLVEKSK